MRRRLLSLICMALLLTGCGASSGTGIPDGLAWTAQVLQSQETGAILAANDRPDAPPLDVSAQVERGTVTLTDCGSGESYTVTLSPIEKVGAVNAAYTLAFPDGREGYAVYGVTEYFDGDREATLYLTVDQRTLRLTAPLPAESQLDNGI